MSDVRYVRGGPLWWDTVDLDLFRKPAEPRLVIGTKGFVRAYADMMERGYKVPERARLLPESEPSPHDWYQPRERLWFCELHGIRFAVMDVNPDCALSQVDEAWEHGNCRDDTGAVG